MRSILLAVAAILACVPVQASQATSDSLKVIGEFSNLRYTEEHAYGYSVQLWKKGDQLLGLLLVAEGSAEDIPIGLLDAVGFQASTGRLSFQAKLTTGVVLLAGGRQEPSRDLFEFSGTLHGDTLSGEMKRMDMLHPGVKPLSKRLLLRNTSGEMMTRLATTYADWKRSTDQLLRLRGPRW